VTEPSAQQLLGKIPEYVLAVCNRLRRSGHVAWVVGGSIRDLLLCELYPDSPHIPTDFDLASDARPERVSELFSRVVPTGQAHGTVTVHWARHQVEVTTLRGESEYADGRHPGRVEYIDDIERDLARRDFTINAMALDIGSKSLIDPFGGLDDLRAGLLRAVGDPEQRFREDGLRVLRAARFAAVLNFDIEPRTLQAIAPSLSSYGKVSAERVRDEWLKSMKASRPSRAFRLMLDHGLLQITAPELVSMSGCTQNRHHAYDVWEHTLQVLDQVEPGTPELRLAALLHDVGKPSCRILDPKTRDYTFHHHEKNGSAMADQILRRLRFSNQMRQQVTHLVRHHLVVYDSSWTDAAVRRWLTRVGADRKDEVLALCRADILGKGPDPQDELSLLEELQGRLRHLAQASLALKVGDLAIDGNEVMSELGVAPGPIVGGLLRRLLDDVLEAPEHNRREWLLERCRELLTEDSDSDSDSSLASRGERSNH